MALISPQTLAFSSPRSSFCPSPSRSTVNLSSPFAQSIARKAPVRTISGTRSLTERSMASSVSGFDSSVLDALGDVSILSAATDEPVFFRDLWDQNEVWHFIGFFLFFNFYRFLFLNVWIVNCVLIIEICLLFN